jgi:hypothetical protein
MSMITSPFTDAMAEMDKAQDKATMFALRSSGRYLARAAKAVAPVYHGTDPRAMAESGNLKKSIRNAKRLTSGGGMYTLKVGPFGTKKAGTAVVRHGTAGALSSVKAGTSTKGQIRGVQLYRGQQESIYGYMAAGLAGAEGGMQGIYEAAYNRAFARFTA